MSDKASGSVSAALRALAGKPSAVPTADAEPDVERTPDLGQGGTRGDSGVDPLVARYGRPEATMSDLLRDIAARGPRR